MAEAWLPLLALRRVQRAASHQSIVLIGGGTGLIGDPSGKAGERQLNPQAQVVAWAEGLKTQVKVFLVSTMLSSPTATNGSQRLRSSLPCEMSVNTFRWVRWSQRNRCGHA